MDLLIKNAFADSKASYIVDLWAPEYDDYVADLPEGEDPITKAKMANDNIREHIYSMTRKKHKAIQTIADFETH